MLTFFLSLPSYRLKITLSKRRSWRGQKKAAVRQGSRISRFFRHIFEKEKIKAIVGGNLAILVLASSVLSGRASAFSVVTETEITTLSSSAVELTTDVTLRAPLNKIKITQGFSPLHQAIDFDGKSGDPVYPVMKGQIATVIYDQFDLGNYIVIDHDSGLKSIYAHLSKIEVSPGDEVDTDKAIGEIGATGQAFGDHLHFELIDNGRFINPLKILPI